MSHDGEGSMVFGRCVFGGPHLVFVALDNQNTNTNTIIIEPPKMATIRERSRGSGGNSGHGDSGGLNDIVQPAGLSGHADIAASSATATATAMAAPARQLPAADPAAMPLNAAAAPSEGVPLRESKDKVGQVAHDVWVRNGK